MTINTTCNASYVSPALLTGEERFGVGSVLRVERIRGHGLEEIREVKIRRSAVGEQQVWSL